VPGLDAVREIARAFGEFHRRATTAINPSVLRVTIPGFHDPPARLRALSKVIAEDPAGRLADVENEVAAVDRYRRLGDASLAMQPPQVPQRVVHFDAKADNVLLDDRTGRVRAIVDLDTVMPGSVLWDVGDLARSLTATEAEDELDASRVTFHQERFDALLDGYRSEADAFLTPAELSGLTLAPVVVTFEQAVRFLTDHLAGDTYYRIAHPGHNAQRARAQLALLGSMVAAGLGPGQ
jgi:Ser/Thr protein kinase RdoA (MazF antagonist)